MMHLTLTMTNTETRRDRAGSRGPLRLLRSKFEMLVKPRELLPGETRHF